MAGLTHGSTEGHRFESAPQVGSRPRCVLLCHQEVVDVALHVATYAGQRVANACSTSISCQKASR
jgi:hypothetical protein